MPKPEEYTIGWICAVNTELIAARAFLDESHGKPEGVAQNDDNNYALGRMGKHNVVIAILPKGEYGTTTAATVARNMVHSFPNVRIGLMVGIAGGAPSEKHDIRLGDIVVSSRGGGMGGVFQYDYGKTLQNGSFVETGSLNQPPQVLLGAVNGLEADYAMDGHQLDSKVEEALKLWPRLRRSHSRPPTTSDRLYKSDVTHPPDSTSDCVQACSEDLADLVPRHERGEHDDNPAIHFGLIASGNQVMKDAHVRDQLVAEKGVLCFEMEAAGLMNHFPCLVIRGICDYSDTHKNKSWQGFAAMVAAAYAKDLLGQISSTRIEMETTLAEKLQSIETKQEHLLGVLNQTKTAVTETNYNQHMADVKAWLAPPDSSINAKRARELRHDGTGNWFLQSSSFREWECGSRQHLWLYGMPGCGKTVLLTTVYDHFKQEDRIVLKFFFDFGDEQKRIVESMLRELIFQLYTLEAKATWKVDHLFKVCQKGRDQPDSIALSSCLQSILKDPRPVYIFVDALDECSERAKLLKWMESIIAVHDFAHVKLIMTARPEAEFDQQLPALIQKSSCISLQTELMNADIQSYVQCSLDARSGFKKWISVPSILQRISLEVGSKADGMFRWATCQLDSLEHCINQEEIEFALKRMPRNLDDTYEQILSNIPDNRKDKSMRLLRFLAFSPKPLTLDEAVDIVAIRPEGFKFEDRLFIPKDILQFCPGLISIHRVQQDPWEWPDVDEVHLAHFSVKEYLLSVQESFQPICASISILRTLFTYIWSAREFVNGYAKEPLNDQMAVLDGLVFERFPLLGYLVRELAGFFRLAEEPDDIVEETANILHDALGSAILRDRRGALGNANPFDPVHQMGLYFACSNKLEKTARSLITRNVEADTGGDFAAALRGASYSGLHRIVRELLDIIPKSESQHEILGSALRIASKEGHDKVVQIMLSHETEFCSCENEFCDASAIIGAAERGHLEVVRLLLCSGAAVSEKCSYWGRIPKHDEGNALIAASKMGFWEIGKLLLEHGADVNAPIHGVTALQMALNAGSLEMIQGLLEYGAEANAQFLHGALTFVIHSRRNSKEIVRLLLGHGADVNAHKTQTSEHINHRNRPLSAAVAVGRPDLVRLLLDHGSDVDGLSSMGELPPVPYGMHVLTPDNRQDNVHLPAQGVADPNELDRKGYSILYQAVESGCLEITKLLVQAGANLNPARFGFSEMVTMAFDRFHFDTALYLLREAEDLHIPREDGYLKDQIPLVFLVWVSQHVTVDIPDIPELSEEISRLRGLSPEVQQRRMSVELGDTVITLDDLICDDYRTWSRLKMCETLRLLPHPPP